MGLTSIFGKKKNADDEKNQHDDLKSHIIDDRKEEKSVDKLAKAKEDIRKKMEEIEKRSIEKKEDKDNKEPEPEKKDTIEKKDPKEAIEPPKEEKKEIKNTDETTDTKKSENTPKKDEKSSQDENKPESEENKSETGLSSEEKLRKAKEEILKKMKESGKNQTPPNADQDNTKDSKDEKKKTDDSDEEEEKSKEDIKKIALDALMKDANTARDIDITGGTEIEKYDLIADEVKATVTIYNVQNQYIPIYYVKRPKVTAGTYAILNAIREQLILLVNITTKEFVDPSALNVVKQKFMKKAYNLLDKYLPSISDEEKKTLAGNLIHEMLGLGEIELVLADPYLEEIVVNGHNDPVWVYHKHHGWLKTNIFIPTEDKIYNFSSAIGRRVGREITNLEPLMDAHLSTGDRVNATLFPISTGGNTITIRKFSRSPWTIIHFLEANTLSKEVAAILWLAIQYELNILVAGGTASGKTSMLNILMPFMPPNQRILSIEDTREINLPKFLHWVPFSSRQPNPEGKGEVSMLDLLANSLRMRPDRIIIGEIRRAKEAEVMFEAIRTGHSAYATFHGDKAEEVFKRLTNPPINLPVSSLSALHLVVVQYRHRRKGIRRTLEVAEIIKAEEGNAMNIIYQWNPRTDTLEKLNRPYRLYKEIRLYTGMTNEEMEKNIENKIKIFDWMTNYQIKTINTVGKIIAEYYRDEEKIVALAQKNESPRELLGEELYAEIAPKEEKPKEG